MIRAQLDHAEVVRFVQREHRQRGADVVVVVGGCFLHAETAPQHGGEHFLGGGLAGRARDGDNAGGGGHQTAVVRCEFVQRGEGVRHL